MDRYTCKDNKQKMREIDICPICGETVHTLEEKRGGTVTDRLERRWHKDCWDKEEDRKEKERNAQSRG